jgi:branched-subunit amino acid transport protein
VTGLELLVILGMAVAVYMPKVLPLAVVSQQQADALKRWLVYVAPAVLGALVAPSIVLHPPGLELAAYAVAAGVAVVTRHMLAAIGAGAVALVIATLLR